MLYGNTAGFINGVEDLGEKFMADAHSTLKVWTAEPLLEAPAQRRGKGRPRSRGKLSKQNAVRYLTVEAWSAEHFEKESRRIVFRQGAKGDLEVRFWVKEVWTLEPEWQEGPRKRQLVVRQDRDGGRKYSLTNLPPGLPWERYGYLQGQRYWVEHAFHEAKSQLGMAQYQVRVWRG
jgi:SRSO17 transposase